MNLIKISYLILILFSFSQSLWAATTRTGIKTWPTKNIPFIIKKNVPQKINQDIRRAITRLNSLNIIKFVEKSENYTTESVVFTYTKNDCSSVLGWNSNHATLVRVSEICGYGNILHELLHSLGVDHEHLHPQKDFSLNLDRVQTGLENQFIDRDAISLTDYDPESIMHYPSHGSSVCGNLKDPKWSKLPKERLPHLKCQSRNWKMKRSFLSGVDCSKECAVFLNRDDKPFGGQRIDLSPLDIEGLKILYK